MSRAPVEVGKGARFGEELLRERTNAAFALDGFDENGADLARKFGAQIGDIVEAHELDAGHDGAEGLAIFRLVGCGDGAKGTAVEALLEGEKLRADSSCPHCASRPACARASFSAPSQASVPVLAKKTRSRPVCSVRRSASSACPSWKKRFETCDERAALTGDGFFNGRMLVAERVDADAAEQVEVAVAVFVDEVNAFAADKENRVALVGREQQRALPRREFDRV